MATNFSSALANEARDVYKLQLGRDKLPAILPVCDLNPKHAKIATVVKSLVKATTNDGTILTTSATQDFYLCSASIDYSKGATANQAAGVIVSVKCTVGGEVVTTISLCNITLTQNVGSMSMDFSRPIKVDRGTNILLSGETYAAGTTVRSCVITGYYDELSGA